MHNKGVRTLHPDYERMLPLWIIMRDVFAGTGTMRDKRESYLPRLNKENNEAYNARLNRTVLYNATYRTVQGMVGMLFRQPPVTEVPQLVLPMLDDITMTGISLSAFAQEVAEESMVVGRVGIYVNFPITNQNMTIADAVSMNIRPNLSIIKAEQIINWKQRRINNKYALSLVVIEETHLIPVDEFEDASVTRYRVLEMDENDKYRVRILEPQKDNKPDLVIESFYPIMNGELMNEIPLLIIGPDNITPDVDTPMLIDLVYTNVAHYMAYSDLAHGCHWSGIPTLLVTGHEMKPDQTLHVGAGEALVLPNPAAKASMVEVGTAGFSALDNQLNRLETHMVALGSRMLESHKVQAESAQTALIYRAGEQSILGSLAHSISTGISQALGIFTRWAGSDEAVRFNLNREFFAQPVTPEMLNALVTGWQQGAISANAKFKFLQKAEFYEPHIKFEEENKLILDGMPQQPKITSSITAKRNPDGSMSVEKIQ
jgi:hypothetical protein